MAEIHVAVADQALGRAFLKAKRGPRLKFGCIEDDLFEMAAVANAISDAVGLRLCDLPMSPPRVLAALDARVEQAEAAD